MSSWKGERGVLVDWLINTEQHPKGCGGRCYRQRTYEGAGGHDIRAAVPRGPSVGERRAVADGQADRPPGAHRVLGLLPPELPADAPVREGVARALRRRRPPRHLR